MRNIIYIFLSVFFSVNGSSQVLKLDSLTGKKLEFEKQVKQLDQFFERFNGTKDSEKVKTDRLSERRHALISLLNFEDSTLFNNETERFISHVLQDSNNVNIDYNDNDWYAKVNCAIKYKNKLHNIILTLKKEGNNKVGFKWVIMGVNAPFINLQPSKPDTSKFIGPMNHELDFMELHNVFNDYYNISLYAYNNFNPDVLSVFFFLIRSKEIHYIKVNSIQYQFLQIKNWFFTVDYFNRPSTNSGWLISSVSKMNDTEKMKYKQNDLYLML
jgi:hypothetical protein